MKKLLVLLPLLLTACSSVQLKRQEPRRGGDVVYHIQPVSCRLLVNAFYCNDYFCDTAILGEEHLNHLVTVYYVHNNYHFSTEGTLTSLDVNGKLQLNEIVNLDRKSVV